MKSLFWGTYIFLLFSLLFVQFVLGPVINRAAKVYLQDSMVEYNRSLAKGVFHMMEIDLQRLPVSAWHERISQLEPQFGYKIALMSFAQLTLSKEQLDQLLQRKIAVVDDGEFLYQRIGNSDMVLRKGPFSVLEPDTGFFTLIIWLAVTIIIGILTFFCVIPYWRQLRKLTGAAIAFGNGQLDTRVKIPKLSNLSQLALAFNTMAERIQQLIGSHKELTNAVSHELRTPLARLRFGLEMLETAEDQKKRHHYARELQTDVNELEELVSELLSFARFDRERPELQFAVLQLEPFLLQVLAESVPEDHPIHCTLHCQLDPQSGHVRFEPKYLARALGNLLQNALNYAGHNIIMVVEKDGDDCIIHVDDDGPGIPPAQRMKVFEPFARLDASRSRASGGYGLGLAIVARVLEWHNGLASVDDSPLGGTRMTVRWPGYSG